jgi:hypothetical protein
MAIFAGILATIILGMLAYLVYSAMKDGVYLLLHNLGLRRLFFRDADLQRMSAYLSNFSYYKKLSPKGQDRFISRLITFMLNKEFSGGKGLLVTEEMKVLVSAAAVQLTFGLKKYKLESLQEIILLPDIFQLHKRSPEYKGATKGHKMYLSWKSFKEGYGNTTDSLNLGLHEMTHALKLTLILNEGFDQHFANRIGYWERMAGEFLAKRQAGPGFLRDYYKAGPEEFFAVCTEAFFENPSQFRKELPEIYQLMVFLLNQDPTAADNDYRVDESYFINNPYNIPLAKDIKPSYKYSTSHWCMYLLAVGVLSILPSFFYVCRLVIFPYTGFLLLFAALGTLGLLQRRYFLERQILSGKFFIMYAYAGFGGTLFSLLLWLNFLLPVTGKQAERHTITGYHAEYNYGKGGRKFAGWRIELDDETQFNSLFLTVGSCPQADDKYMGFEYDRGILGIKNSRGYFFEE